MCLVWFCVFRFLFCVQSLSCHPMSLGEYPVCFPFLKINPLFDTMPRYSPEFGSYPTSHRDNNLHLVKCNVNVMCITIYFSMYFNTCVFKMNYGQMYLVETASNYSLLFIHTRVVYGENELILFAINCSNNVPSCKAVQCLHCIVALSHTLPLYTAFNISIC